MSKCSEKRNFQTRDSRTVLNSDDDDSDESDFSDISESSECSSDGETQLENDTQADDTQSDDDVTASDADSDVTSASNTTFTWLDRATVLRQRFPFSGSPGIPMDQQ